MKFLFPLTFAVPPKPPALPKPSTIILPQPEVGFLSITERPFTEDQAVHKLSQQGFYRHSFPQADIWQDIEGRICGVWLK